MFTAEFIQRLPDGLRASLRNKDYSELLFHAEAFAEEDVDATALVLWQFTSQDESPEALQVLSYALVGRLTGPVADAARVWLLQSRTDDVATLVNILSGLEALAVEGSSLPDYLMSILPDFLTHCLEHSEVAVRISVLDFLRNYEAVLGWPRRFGRIASQNLASGLELCLTDIVMDEEVGELASIVAGLQSDAIPVSPPIKIEPVNALIAQLDKIPDAADLAQFMRVRRLLDDAKRQAQQDNRPILTVRILDGAIGSFLSCVKHVFDLCRFENVDPTDKVWLPAPAASEAKHLRARATTTQETFDRFQLAGAIAEQSPNATARLAQLPPRQAQAVASMLQEASKSGIEAEFILTSPEISDSQEIVTFGHAAESLATWAPAAQAAERAAEERPEVYSDEVPQANTVKHVLQAVVAILERGEVRIQDIDNISSNRQVNYHISAACSIGLLDDNNEPTNLGRQLQGKTSEEQLSIAAVAFERSMVGRAWRAWAKKSRLAEVSPETAEEFLRSRARGISGSTIPRRASTLRKWQAELLKFYRHK